MEISRAAELKAALLKLLVVNIAGKSWARRVQFLKFTA